MFFANIRSLANYLHDQKRRNPSSLIHPKFSPKKISHTDTFDTFQQFSQPPPYRSLVNYATIEENKILCASVFSNDRNQEEETRGGFAVAFSKFEQKDSPSFNRVLLNGGKAAKHQTSPLKFPRKEAWSLSLSSWPRVTMVKIHPSSILIFEISFLLYIQSTGYSLGGKWNCEEARQRVPFFFFLPVGFRVKFQRFPCFNIFFFFGFSFFSVAMSIGTKKNKGIPCWRGCFSFDPFFSFSPFFFRIFSFMHGIEV